MPLLSPLTLTGDLVTLCPLSHDDHEGLVAAAGDGRLWESTLTNVAAPDRMREEIDRRLGLQEQGTMLPFTIRRADDGRIIGMTTYMNIDDRNRRVEIGSTWTAASTHGSGTNADCKLLLLTHAFEEVGVLAVELRTHWLNVRSRAAIERLGAKLDGILRQHMVMADGSVRDTAVYSIVAAEWAAVRGELRRRVGAALATTGGMR